MVDKGSIIVDGYVYSYGEVGFYKQRQGQRELIAISEKEYRWAADKFYDFNWR